MPLKIIGAGFGRTGTKSLKDALELLGFGPCHHMMEVLENLETARHWNAAARGEQMDWEEVFEGYQSAVDWPCASYWRELADFYPDAKVILSVRSPESWYESAMNTIFSAANSARVRDRTDAGETEDMRPMMKKIFIDTFKGVPLTDQAHTMSVFEAHNQEVIATIAPERLLVFEAVQGWEPLCAFLGVPVPDVPYINVNSSAEFTERLKELAKDA